MIGALLMCFVAGGPMAMAQQGDENQGSTASPPMSVLPQFQPNPDPRIRNLNLDIFEYALEGPAPSCGKKCPEDVAWVEAWSCIVKACGTDGDNRSMNCLKHFSKPVDDLSKKELGNKLLCDIVKSPGVDTRKALIKSFSSFASKEDGLVEGIAYVDAFEGKVTACQAEIKSYVGPYGPAWNTRWYRDMSGCRILSKQSTRQAEEKDFSKWLEGNCSKIVNPDIRNACYAPGATFPK
jgi:hypothetical protein